MSENIGDIYLRDQVINKALKILDRTACVNKQRSGFAAISLG